MSRRPRASTRTKTHPRDGRGVSRGLNRNATPSRERASRPTAATTRSGVPSLRRPRRWLFVTKVSLSVLLVGATLYVGGQWVLHQSYFRVQHVILTGEVHETAAQILSTTHLSAHPTMVGLSAQALERDLAVYPWIGSISLTKKWPNTVDLSLHEVASVAVAFGAQHVLQYVSATGRDLGPAPLSANLPTLATTPANPAPASWPYQGVRSAAALVASQLPVAFAAQVSQVIVDDLGNVTLQLTTPIRFFLGPATNLNAKFVAVASAIAHGTFVAGDLVDVTTPTELSVTGPSPS